MHRLSIGRRRHISMIIVMIIPLAPRDPPIPTTSTDAQPTHQPSQTHPNTFQDQKTRPPGAKWATLGGKKVGHAPAENRTRGSTMATLNFTTKPLAHKFFMPTDWLSRYMYLANKYKFAIFFALPVRTCSSHAHSLLTFTLLHLTLPHQHPLQDAAAPRLYHTQHIALPAAWICLYLGI